MNLKTEIVGELPTTIKTSKYQQVINQALELKPGQFLRIGGNENTHSMGFTLRQLLKRRKITDLNISVRNNEVFLFKK